MKQYGMPEMAAIKSATMETAKLLRIEKDLGSLEVGKIAILLLLRQPSKRYQRHGKCDVRDERGKVYKN